MINYTRFIDYIGHTQLLPEAVHDSVMSIVHSDTPVKNKYSQITKVVRSLIAKGEDTGLEGDKPKKGSSRVVYFPKEPTKLKIDNQDTELHTALKIAYPGTLDKYNHSGRLLGEHQNKIESDPSAQYHSILRPTEKDGEFETNENGVLAPVINSDNRNSNHWIEFGRVSKLKDFRPLTKTKDFKNGISHEEFYDAINSQWRAAHGDLRDESESTEKLLSHPLVKNTISAIHDIGVHPVDFITSNMGVWTHPITSKKHIVISDYGYSNEIARHYMNARKLKYQTMNSKN